MPFNRTLTAFSVASLAALAIAGCASTPTQPRGNAQAATRMPTTSTVAKATVNLSAASGSLVSGQLWLVPTNDGVRASGTIGGLAPNRAHGFHIHEKGDCSAADASSAGGHFDPTGEPHGRVTMARHHAGDTDNIVANAEGVATVDARFEGVVLGGGGANDAVGKAVVVHADPDDYTSQPSGNAGARVACGVVKAG